MASSSFSPSSSSSSSSQFSVDMFALEDEERPRKKTKKAVEEMSSELSVVKEATTTTEAGAAAAAQEHVEVAEEEEEVDQRIDAEGYYEVRLGEFIQGPVKKYRVTKIAGRGVFSIVVICVDVAAVASAATASASASASEPKKENEFAIKILRKNDVMRRSGERELRILRRISEVGGEKGKQTYCLSFLETFDHLGHLCIVTEGLFMNLRQVLNKFGKGIGLSKQAVQRYGRQLALALLHIKRLGIVHLDLKLDNIFVSSNFGVAKLGDFGSARDSNDHLSQGLSDGSSAAYGERIGYIGSRFYRAPEIILGLGPFDHSVDMWALGCTLYEIFTGHVLFPGRYNNEMLRMMMELLGKIPAKSLKRHVAQHNDREPESLHFTSDMQFKRTEVDRISKQSVCKIVRILDVPAGLMAKKLRAASPLSNEEDISLLSDMLEKCLSLDPSRRMSPEQLRKHAFLSQSHR